MGPASVSSSGVITPRFWTVSESYIGEEGGTEGVKLEQQLLVTASGCQVLSTYPFEESLYG